MVKFISSTRWGSSVASLFYLYNVIFVGADETFSIRELEIALRSKNHSSTPGLDGIRYSTLAHVSITPRNKWLNICNQTWSTGAVPSCWKNSRIVSSLKPDRPPIDLMSYHPTALSMILARLKRHIEKNKIYTSSISGFLRRSSIDNVIDPVTSVEC